MARFGSPFGKHNLDRAMSYLASLPDFKPAKPLDQYSPEQVIRKANVFIRQESVGLPIDNRFARGKHKTEASGFSPSLQKSYKQATIAEQRRQMLPPSQRDLPNAKRFVAVHNTREAQSALRKLGKVGVRTADDRSRIKISFQDKRTGKWRTVGQKGGLSRKYVRQLMRDYGGLSGAVGAAYALTYDDEIELDDIGEIEFFDVELGNA